MSVKHNLLSALERHRGEEISGQELADLLHVSRAAVWKAAKALEAEGYGIDALPGRGYRLRPDSDQLSAEGIRLHLPAEYANCAVEAVQEIASTNQTAKRQALEPGPERCLLAANAQTDGRGRLQKRFFSPADTGLYLSLTLRRTRSYSDMVPVTMAAAVAAVRVLERRTDRHPAIKWVNDLYIRGRKICGILTEAALDLESGLLDYAVLGIGINTAPISFPEELHRTATSVSNECGRPVSRSALAACLLDELERELPGVGEPPPCRFLEESRRRSVIVGRDVLVTKGNETFSARALEIDDEGGLVVETPAGRQTLRSGEVSVHLSQDGETPADAAEGSTTPAGRSGAPNRR